MNCAGCGSFRANKVQRDRPPGRGDQKTEAFLIRSVLNRVFQTVGGINREHILQIFLRNTTSGCFNLRLIGSQDDTSFFIIGGVFIKLQIDATGGDETSDFFEIKKGAAARGARNPEKVAGAAYWRTAKSKFAGKKNPFRALRDKSK